MRVWAVVVLGALLGCSSPNTLDGDDGAPTTGGSSSSGTGGASSSGGTGGDAGATDAGEPGRGGTGGSTGGAASQAGAGGHAEGATGGSTPEGGKGGTVAGTSSTAGAGGTGAKAGESGMGGLPSAGKGGSSPGGAGAGSMAGGEMGGTGGTEPTTRSLLGCGQSSSGYNCTTDSYLWKCPDTATPAGSYMVPTGSTVKSDCVAAGAPDEWCCKVDCILDTTKKPEDFCAPPEKPYECRTSVPICFGPL